MFTRLFIGNVARVTRNGIRQFSAPAGESTASAATPKTSIAVPPWGLVGIGITAAGFFGKMLHDDNLETRRELQEVRRESREDRKELREDIKALEGKMERGFKAIADDIAALRPQN